MNKILEKLGELGFAVLDRLLGSDIVEDTMAQEQSKIDTQIRWLNGLTTTPGNWVAIPEIFAFMQMTGDLKTQKDIKFNSNFGYPVRIFVNQINGEMRLFPATLFETNG